MPYLVTLVVVHKHISLCRVLSKKSIAQRIRSKNIYNAILLSKANRSNSNENQNNLWHHCSDKCYLGICPIYVYKVPAKILLFTWLEQTYFSSFCSEQRHSSSLLQLPSEWPAALHQPLQMYSEILQRKKSDLFVRIPENFDSFLNQFMY